MFSCWWRRGRRGDLNRELASRQFALDGGGDGGNHAQARERPANETTRELDVQSRHLLSGRGGGGGRCGAARERGVAVIL